MRGGDVAQQELALPRPSLVRFVIGERSHGRWRVDAQDDEDLQPASVSELERVVERLRAVAGPFEGAGWMRTSRSGGLA